MDQQIKRLSVVIASCMLWLMSFAQSAVTGIVKDASGEPLIGVSVMVKGTSTGTVTDFDGRFSLQSVSSSAQLQFSYIGYETKTVNVGSTTNFNIVLNEDNAALEEVVVIGYQTVKRRDLTGSVASVNNKQLTSAPVANVAQALQGKLAGVNVVSQDGRPDANISIRVRGGGSISQSNEPLILIDGVAGNLNDVPSDQIESIDVLKDASSTAIYGARGANGVILVTTKRAKDGRATITYSGYVKFNTPTKYIEALDPYDYLAYMWANAEANGSYYSESVAKLFGLGSYGNIENYRNVSKYDIQKDVYKSSISHNHDLSVSGGSEKTKFILGVNYSDEEGMKANSFNRRAGVSLKVDQKINRALDASLDIRYTDVTSMSNEGTTSGQGSVLSSSYRFRPIATSDIERYGNTDAFREGAVEAYGKQWLWDMYDPYQSILDYEPLKQRQSLRATASLNWQIIKGLVYHTDLSLSRSWNQNKTWSGAIYNKYMDDTTGEKLYAGAAALYKGDSWGLRWTNTLNYNWEINKSNRLNVLVGHEITNSGGNSMTISTDYFPVNYTKDNAFAMINQYDKTASTNTNPFYSGYNISERIISYFGRLNYTLLDRYLLTVTMRADGSSKFAPSHRWGYFPAAALAWRINDEVFMQNVKWLSNLKLRLSYGTVGNDGIDSSLWSQTWTSENDSRWQYSIDNKAQASYDLASTTMANEDLKWETTITRNIGLDWGILNNRINGTIDVYWNTTKDLLMLTTLPAITGFTATYANIGKTSNKGVEFSVNAAIVQTKDFNINVGANINFNKNKVDELAPGVNGIYGTGWFSANNPSNDMILMEGEPVGLVRGLTYVGMYTTDDFTYDPATKVYTLKSGVPDVSPQITGVMHGLETNVPSGQNAHPGMAKYEDLDGDGMVDEKDYDVIADMNALHTGGFNITGNYKNLDFGLYFNWSYGNKIYNINKMCCMMGYKENGVFQNKMAFMKDCYKIYDIQNNELIRKYSPEELNALNANAEYPLFYNENGTVSTLGIENGSYLRLNTLTVGYTLPKTLISKVGLSNFRVYGTVYNVFTITGYDGLDPEVNSNGNLNNARYPTPGLDWGTYPRARSFVVGLNVSF